MITIFMTEVEYQHQNTAARHLLMQCANTILDKNERQDAPFDTERQFEMGPDEFHKLGRLVAGEAP